MWDYNKKRRCLKRHNKQTNKQTIIMIIIALSSSLPKLCDKNIFEKKQPLVVFKVVRNIRETMSNVSKRQWILKTFLTTSSRTSVCFFKLYTHTHTHTHIDTLFNKVGILSSFSFFITGESSSSAIKTRFETHQKCAQFWKKNCRKKSGSSSNVMNALTKVVVNVDELDQWTTAISYHVWFVQFGAA